MAMSRSLAIPKAMRPIYESVVGLTDRVCRDHLDREYRDLARAMAAALCRKRPSPLGSGQPRSWACGIVHVLGQLNFLSDPGTRPCMATADLCAAFGVGQSTASAKARVISDILRPHRMDPAWMRADLIDRNPLVWLVELDGLVVDLRDMPREVQVMAHEQGLIPFVPADQEENAGPLPEP